VTPPPRKKGSVYPTVDLFGKNDPKFLSLRIKNKKEIAIFRQEVPACRQNKARIQNSSNVHSDL